MAEILFINPTESFGVNKEVNGTLILATKLLHAGFDTDVLRFCQTENFGKDYCAFISEITEMILAASPKCVSFYTLWPNYHIMLRIAREVKLRNPELFIILGGPQASATAAVTMEAAPYVDYICTGEGESTVVPFFRALLLAEGSLAQIPGLYYRQGDAVLCTGGEVPLCDLNTLPRWDDRLYLDKYLQPEPDLHSSTYYMPIDAGRGCPFGCTFCCSSRFWRRAYRLKSPERIVEDILFYNQKFGIKSFWLSHDAFTTNRKLVDKVCDHILESGLDIQWRCTSRIDCLSEELIVKMKQAGLRAIEMGIETGSLRMQKLINKKLDLSNARHMIDFMLKQDLQVALFFMYGFPEETEDDLNDTLELLFTVMDMGVLYASLSFCRFNPATPITNEHFDKLVLDPQIKILSRGIYGYEEELPTIRENKALFPFFYHLSSPVRNDYQYLNFLAHLYKRYSAATRYLRPLYQGDNLRFYRDFCRNNPECFSGDISQIVEHVRHRPYELLCNTIRDFDLPYLPQLKGLLKYICDTQRIFHGKEDAVLREVYDFSYIDFKMKLPIQEYSDGKTEILLQKKDGKTSMKVLRFL